MLHYGTGLFDMYTSRVSFWGSACGAYFVLFFLAAGVLSALAPAFFFPAAA